MDYKVINMTTIDSPGIEALYKSSAIHYLQQNLHIDIPGKSPIYLDERGNEVVFARQYGAEFKFDMMKEYYGL